MSKPRVIAWEGRGSCLGAELWDISRAVGYQSHAEKHLQHSPGARGQEQDPWPGMEEQEQDPCPASPAQLRARAAAAPQGSPAESFSRAGTSPPHVHPQPQTISASKSELGSVSHTLGGEAKLSLRMQLINQPFLP